jgi:uncharacterized protein YdhG (YjbR/CyaY superfamily)
MPTPIDEYLAKLEDPAAKKALTALRAQLKKLLPDAREELSYGMPAFRHESGKVVAGFGFFGRNCGYYPHSSGVVGKAQDKLAGYRTTVGGVTFPAQKPLPLGAVTALVNVRLDEITRGNSPKRGAAKRGAAKKKVAARKSVKK